MIETSLTIGLYGGSFNPPHLAHVMVVAWALASGEVDEVWVIPTGGHPFGKPLAPFDDRLEMCHRAFACFGERVRLLEVEREPRVHYSIETAWELTRRHPGHCWRWIMGSDTLDDAPKWRQFEDLMRLAPPLVIPRQSFESPRPEATPASNSSFALPNISSTHIRDCLATGRAESLRDLLPGHVLEYIKEKGLYNPGKSAS